MTSSMLNLFTNQEGFEDALTNFLSLKKKRVHYKRTTYTKVYKNDVVNGEVITDDVIRWGELRKIYIELANYFPPPLFLQSDNEYTDTGIIRTWHQVYQNETYNYKGTIYKGQNFQVSEAEIIGTEDFNIDERLYLHKELLERIKAQEKLEVIFKDMQNKVRKLQQGYKIAEL